MTWALSIFGCMLRTPVCWKALWDHTVGGLDTDSAPGYQAVTFGDTL